MPAIYFQDYFETYTPGAVVPTGMITPGGVGSTILGSGTGFEFSQCWSVGDAWRDGGTSSSEFVGNITMFVALNRQTVGDENVNDFMQLLNGTSPFQLNIGAPALWRCHPEQDSTLSFYAGPSNNFFMGNTGKPPSGADPFVMTQFDWFTMQANVVFSAKDIVTTTTTVSGTTTTTITNTSSNHSLGVDSTVLIDGVEMFTASVNDTGTIIEALPYPHAQVNIPFWNGAGWFFDSMTYEALTGTNTYPMPGAPVVRASQLMVEVGMQPNPLARASQLANELQFLPSGTSRGQARASQLIIELMMRKAVASGGTWRCYEA